MDGVWQPLRLGESGGTSVLRRLAAKLAVVAATSLLPRNSLFWERVSLSLRKNVTAVGASVGFGGKTLSFLI